MPHLHQQNETDRKLPLVLRPLKEVQATPLRLLRLLAFCDPASAGWSGHRSHIRLSVPLNLVPNHAIYLLGLSPFLRPFMLMEMLSFPPLQALPIESLTFKAPVHICFNPVIVTQFSPVTADHYCQVDAVQNHHRNDPSGTSVSGFLD